VQYSARTYHEARAGITDESTFRPLNSPEKYAFTLDAQSGEGVHSFSMVDNLTGEIAR
jgi:hypothetical protein